MAEKPPLRAASRVIARIQHQRFNTSSTVMPEIFQPPCDAASSEPRATMSAISRCISIASSPEGATLILSSPRKAEPGKYVMLATQVDGTASGPGDWLLHQRSRPGANLAVRREGRKGISALAASYM